MGCLRISDDRAACPHTEQVADRDEAKPHIVFDLNATALYELAAPSTPTEVRDRVESLLVDGQEVTVADIRKMKPIPSRPARNSLPTQPRSGWEIHEHEQNAGDNNGTGDDRNSLHKVSDHSLSPR